MSRQQKTRTQTCGRDEAKTRILDAKGQLELAALVDASSAPEQRKAAASCAVLAGVAAADAACCKALGERSRSQDHRNASKLLGQISPGGSDAAKQFDRLLGLKDESQYGFSEVTGQKLTSVVRRAEALVSFAEEVLRR